MQIYIRLRAVGHILSTGKIVAIIVEHVLANSFINIVAHLLYSLSTVQMVLSRNDEVVPFSEQMSSIHSLLLHFYVYLVLDLSLSYSVSRITPY